MLVYAAVFPIGGPVRGSIHECSMSDDIVVQLADGVYRPAMSCD